MERIYLDWAATTTMRPEAVDAMVPWLSQAYNPNSTHADGRRARAAIDEARVEVARVLGAWPREIVFTGSGTEADNLAVFGIAQARPERRHIVTSTVEHHAVAHAVDALEERGWSVTRVAPAETGAIWAAAVAAALRPETALVSVMLGNNEIGTIAPIAEIAAAARGVGACMHTDAVQTAAYLDLTVDALGVDALALAGHKFSGPKGVGALYVRTGTPLRAQQLGGGQEAGRRSGTENVAGIVAFARALTLAAAERAAACQRITALREELEARILAAVPDAQVLAASAPRLPHITAIAFPEEASDALLMALDLEGVSASAGSACAAGSLEPSHVVAALGLPPSLAGGVVRFSLGRTTTQADIERAALVIRAVMARSVSLRVSV